MIGSCSNWIAAQLDAICADRVFQIAAREPRIRPIGWTKFGHPSHCCEQQNPIALTCHIAPPRGRPHICGQRKADAVIGLFGLQTLSAATQIYHAMLVFGLGLLGRCRQDATHRNVLLVSLLVFSAA
jgi:hypothetical protein